MGAGVHVTHLPKGFFFFFFFFFFLLKIEGVSGFQTPSEDSLELCRVSERASERLSERSSECLLAPHYTRFIDIHK